MNRSITIGVALGLLAQVSVATSPDDRFEKEQKRLDAACEAAREKKLAPERERHIEECVAKKQRPDRATCERFYADYGNQSGNRAPLYMDLPECVEAFEHRRQKEH